MWLVQICNSGDLCRYFNIYPMYSVAFVVWWIITQWHLPIVDIWGGCKYCNWHFVWIWRLPLQTSCKSLKWYVTVCFLGLFVNGRYHTACRYSGPMVWNSASVTSLKICYYGRQWDLIWSNDTYIRTHGANPERYKYSIKRTWCDEVWK